MSVAARAVGATLDRIEGPEKVTGAVRYAFEHDPEGVAYAAIVQSAIAKGAVHRVDAPDGVALLWHANTPRLADASGELAVLQSPDVAYRGQIVAAVVAETLEEAQEAARLVRIDYDVEPHDVELDAEHPRRYTPEKVNPNEEPDTEQGDFDAAFAAADVSVDVTYETPWFHNNPMEPHATVVRWEADGSVTFYDSNQGAARARDTLARTFGLQREQVRVISPHVGGGFGSKGTPRPHAVLAALAAQAVGRPVKLAVTRQQMFALTGYRTPTIQRLRLGASRDGRLTALAHEVVEQTSHVQEFAEQTAIATRMMYAAPNLRTSHQLVALDVPTPSWMRAPGECPGMYALESALDELADACRLDPVELRILNEPDRDPATGFPFSSRNLVACLRDGAERFGWSERRSFREGDWLVGTGVASSTYPARRGASHAAVRREADGTYVVRIAAADIGTGARTALTQIAADALDVAPGEVRVELGDSALPEAPLAGGSMGTASWGGAVIRACEALRENGSEGYADTRDEIRAQEQYARHAFGAQFAEVRVNAHTGELRVSRLLGVFAVGRIVNPKLARSQLVGGMTMGLGMALLEEGVVDPRFGDVVNHDLASYHIPTYADVTEIEAHWVDEHDEHVGPLGSKGIGEIGIVGTAAAIASAVHAATGHRFRSLPIRLDQILEVLSLSSQGWSSGSTPSRS